MTYLWNPAYAAMEQLATCLCAQIEADGLPALCFCGVLPGEIPAYNGGEECDAGMAYVRLITMYPASGVGTQNVSVGNCSSLLGFDLEVGIMRPSPIGDEEGPSDAELLESTELQLADAIAMRKAIACCTGQKNWILGAYTPYGPEGGIIGGTWEVNMVEG
jgi:hypothetical protein